MEKHIALLVITSVFMAVTMSFNFYEAIASDPGPLQDFCVAVEDANSAVFVNGLVCKNPKKVTAEDFIFRGFNTIGDTNNLSRANATLLDVTKVPALNTQGLSIAHIDFGPHGLNTPHHHPRASEIFVVLNGTIYVGFISSDYRLFSTVLNSGDVFIFPQGLIHFQYNLKRSQARAITAFGSQHPGRVNSAQALFGVTPAILDDVLIKAYQVDDATIEELRYQFTDALNEDRKKWNKNVY